MINDNCFKIAWKLLNAVSAQEGLERVLQKLYWLRQCIYCRDSQKVVSPETPEIHAAFEHLIRTGCVKFRNVGDDKIGITLLAREGSK